MKSSVLQNTVGNFAKNTTTGNLSHTSIDKEKSPISFGSFHYSKNAKPSLE